MCKKKKDSIIIINYCGVNLLMQLNLQEREAANYVGATGENCNINNEENAIYAQSIEVDKKSVGGWGPAFLLLGTYTRQLP